MSENELQKLLARSIALVADLFKDEVDKGGVPYIIHCLYVMNKQKTTKGKIVGIMHDVLEDTDITERDLFELGYPSDIIKSLVLLDMRKVDYLERIQEIALDKLARDTKLADLEHNSQISRMKSLRKKDFDRLIKYIRAYQYLKY